MRGVIKRGYVREIMGVWGKGIVKLLFRCVKYCQDDHDTRNTVEQRRPGGWRRRWAWIFRFLCQALSDGDIVVRCGGSLPIFVPTFISYFVPRISHSRYFLFVLKF